MKSPSIYRLGFLTVVLGAAINVVGTNVLSPSQRRVDVDADNGQLVLQSHQASTFRETVSTELEWDTRLADNTTGNFVFNSVYSLMQRWPNTYWRNGS